MPRNVVEHDRQGRGFGDGTIVLVEALLHRLVVVRGHDEGGIGSRFFGVAGQPDGFGCAVRPGACHHLEATGSLLTDDRNNPIMFFVAQSGAFPGRPTGTDAGGPDFDMPIDKATEGSLVNASITKRSDQRHGQTSKHLTLTGHSALPSCSIRFLASAQTDSPSVS